MKYITIVEGHHCCSYCLWLILY